MTHALTPAHLAAELQPLIDHLNRVNHANLVLTLADNEVIVEEYEVPLVIIEAAHDVQEAHDAVVRSLPLWDLTI